MGSIESITNYYKVGIAKHVIGVALSAGIFGTAYLLNAELPKNVRLALSELEVVLITGLAVNQLLAIEIYRNYHRVSKILREEGWDDHIPAKFMKWWCYRNMIRIASKNEGFEKEVTAYMSSKGYEGIDLNLI